MIKFSKHSGIYTMEVKQELPTTLYQAWRFFSNPENLSKITPKQMGFKITSENEASIYPGQIITYKVGILPMIKSSWVTEITHTKDKKYFIDEQRFGPYKMWHHLHRFESNERGVIMTDKVSYKLPFGFLGSLAHILFIKNKLKSIFAYRFNYLQNYYSLKN